MRTCLASAVVAAVVMLAPPVIACTPFPSPRWDLVPQSDGPAIAIGRVVSVVPDGRDDWNDYVRAEIETLETIQGDVPERFTVRGISERSDDPTVITLWCGRMMTDQPGDVVMVTEWGEAGYRLLMPMQIAAPYQKRMDDYRQVPHVQP